MLTVVIPIVNMLTVLMPIVCMLNVSILSVVLLSAVIMNTKATVSVASVLDERQQRIFFLPDAVPK